MLCPSVSLHTGATESGKQQRERGRRTAERTTGKSGDDDVVDGLRTGQYTCTVIVFQALLRTAAIHENAANMATSRRMTLKKPPALWEPPTEASVGYAAQGKTVQRQMQRPGVVVVVVDAQVLRHLPS